MPKFKAYFSLYSCVHLALPPLSTWNDGSNDWATMVPSPTPANGKIQKTNLKQI